MITRTHAFSSRTIVDVIHYIDELLNSLEVRPILNYRLIEYHLVDSEKQPFMLIRVMEGRLEYSKSYTDEQSDAKNQLFNKIESGLLKI